MKTLEFRDGERDVPDHVAVMMAGVQTERLTYEQALRTSEQKLLSDRLNKAQGDLVAEHMRRTRLR